MTIPHKAHFLSVANTFLAQVTLVVCSCVHQTVVALHRACVVTSFSSRYMILPMPHGSVLRIEPVKIRRDESDFECVASNSEGPDAIASASLEIYMEGQGQ